MNGLFELFPTNTAQHRLNPGNKLAGRKRLGDIVIGACIQPRDLVVLLCFGGQHNHRQLFSQLIAFQSAQQLQTRGTGHHPIQQNQIWAAVNNNGMGLLGILRLQHIVVSGL